MTTTATIHTNKGDIRVNLFEFQAPKTVRNFTGLAEGTQEWTDPRVRAKSTAPLYDGTMQLMLGCRYVLPIAVSLEPSAPAVVVGSLTRVRDQDDCHRIMEWIADAHQGATAIPTIYHRQEDPLLTQVRDLVRN